MSLDAHFVDCNDGALASAYTLATDEGGMARTLGLADLSPMRRVGFKGAGAVDWLKSQGVAMPEINCLARQQDGAMVFRLGANDVMITSDLGAAASLPDDLVRSWNGLDDPPREPRGFPMPRQDGFCWFVLSGKHAASCLAKLCAVDLRPHRFPIGSIAQTSVARLSAVVARDDLGDVLAFHLFSDSASATYWWDCLVDAMQEFGGNAVGIDALRSL